jgi:hypothetical protein
MSVQARRFRTQTSALGGKLPLARFRGDEVAAQRGDIEAGLASCGVPTAAAIRLSVQQAGKLR